jgi:secondary thiamine-phosphate synthase enzyme
MRKILSYDTSQKQEIISITRDLQKIIDENHIENGLLIAYSLHTTAGLFIQEIAEEDLNQDILDYYKDLVKDEKNYRHSCAKHPNENYILGAQNAPSHIRHTLINQNVIIDVKRGKLNLGQWQDVGLVELDGPRKNRKILIKILEDKDE